SNWGGLAISGPLANTPSAKLTGRGGAGARAVTFAPARDRKQANPMSRTPKPRPTWIDSASQQTRAPPTAGTGECDSVLHMPAPTFNDHLVIGKKDRGKPASRERSWNGR